jgi:hypothetical protein
MSEGLVSQAHEKAGERLSTIRIRQIKSAGIPKTDPPQRRVGGNTLGPENIPGSAMISNCAFVICATLLTKGR